jgi:formate dehydrogenase subunit gamma
LKEQRLRDIPVRAEPGGDLPAAERAALMAAVQAHRGAEGALLPILHAVQETLGWVPPRVLPLLAHELNLSRAEVHGVVSFYHYFRQQPPGRHVIHLCRAEACQAAGAAALEAHVKQRLGIDFHGTTADGRHTLEPVYCLGNCACGPSLLVDNCLHAAVTPESFDALLIAEPA